MSEQRIHTTRQESILPRDDDADAVASAERLAASRDQLDRIYAAADAILDDINQTNSARFLEQARQSGGQ
jgi:hypothetical protein